MKGSPLKPTSVSGTASSTDPTFPRSRWLRRLLTTAAREHISPVCTPESVKGDALGSYREKPIGSRSPHDRTVALNAIALIGLSGSGKSTIGPLLAERLGLPHLDVDLILEQREGRTIREIFNTDGEPYFRALDGHPVIWLRVKPESSALRIGHDEARPLLAGQDAVIRLRTMLSERAPTYARLASLTVDTDHASVESVVEAIAAHVTSFEPGR